MYPCLNFCNALCQRSIQNETSSVNFANSVEDLVAQTIEKTIEEVNTDRAVANNTKNRQIVLSLYEKAFLILKMRLI